MRSPGIEVSDPPDRRRPRGLEPSARVTETVGKDAAAPDPCQHRGPGETRMRLGIDLGTTHTIVSCADRGNYPVVGFVDDEGASVDWFPSVVAARDGELRHGFDALAVAGQPGWTLRRSFKRLLG